MSSFFLTMDFITGRCVAADVSNREATEWPPHPGRLFMAMSAACFERGEAAEEVAALQWLEKQTAPVVLASNASERSAVAVYVPVNDKVTASKSLLQSVPGLSRSKQERAFPTVIPEDTNVTFRWDDVEGIDQHLSALQEICTNTIRVGHSSSLVNAYAYVDTVPLGSNDEAENVWMPTRGSSERRMRIVGEGEFERLRLACNSDRIDRFAELMETIESKKKSKDKADKEAVKKARALYEELFGDKYKASARPPVSTAPVLGNWQGYIRQSAESEGESSTVTGHHFDSDLLVLCKLEGPNITVQDTLALTSRLRDAAMSKCELDPPPAWLCGHELDGSVTRDPHAAFLALPYVGSSYADGHLMGMAIALSRNISPAERGVALRGLLLDSNDDPQVIQLLLGRLGEWTVRFESDNSGRHTLQNRTWVGPSRVWASVTPVVLDRFPKSDHVNDRKAWQAEVAESVAVSCEHAGLPKPTAVDVDTTAWFQGVPRAVRKKRRATGDKIPATATLGEGFPMMPSRNGKPARPQIHVHLTFDQAIVGPVLIGAGRFLGYGMCRPLKQTT